MIKVIAIDDNKLQLELIVSTLNSDEFIKCIGISNTENVIDKIKEFEPDAIVLDIEMPQVNGIELKKQIEAVEEIKDTLVIFLTGDESNKERAKQVEYYKFMTKPFNSKSLLKAITHAKIFNSLKDIKQELKLIYT